MTPDDQAADLLRRGYQEVQEFKEFHVGQRVAHTGQLWAYGQGSGVSERIFHNPTSAWSQKYGQDDVEMIIRRDTPDPYAGTHGYWADYHTVVAG